MLIGFDPLDRYLREAERRLGGTALLFADKHGREVIETKQLTYVESPPPPPRELLRISTRPTRNLLLLLLVPRA
jgi:hypothetical protein